MRRPLPLVLASLMLAGACGTAAPDTAAPGVPAHPRTGGLTCEKVDLSWDAAADDHGIAFYDVYHDGQLIVSVPGDRRTAEVGVVPGAAWGLYVNARDEAGNVSQASATVPVTAPPCAPDHVAPTAPRGLTGAADGMTVTLRWAPSSDDIGVRAYDVYRGSVLAGSVTGTPPATTFIDSAYEPKTTYAYSVVARDLQRNMSKRSNTVRITTGTGCTVCGVQVVATETDLPWGLATLPDGSVLYNRRDAHDIIHLDPKTGKKVNVGTVPGVESTDGEGGLTGLAVSPSYAVDHFVYVMHTSPTDNRIVRFRLVNDRLDAASAKVLVSGILRNKFHDGGRLRFGPDGKLYAATGDAQNGDNAQNLAGLNGKVLRINPDGSVPADNPFGTYVWSYGHRNPQGLAFDAQGRLWEQEFGNSAMDETNLIVKGGNYGWPACEGTKGDCAGSVPPKLTYPVAEGSCSGIAITGDVVWIACQRGTRLYRGLIDGDGLSGVQAYFVGTYGRLRTVEPAPDGGLWLTTTNQGDKDGVPDNSDEKVFHVALH
ncbi:PQQ-dependent sugar dehydrogenase [Hamadaea tsunoensis]|uniref:PQQ-dependent sugar dehydrogenase n=1 Tax=Hamadaea tsunoensis TaxID=53368 RepID=UPI0003FC3E9A|nr:PQQ-dependent sugar dehydrogenase [Hamadaea tsunoensis]